MRRPLAAAPGTIASETMIPLLLVLSIAGCVTAQLGVGQGGLSFAIQPPPPPVQQLQPQGPPPAINQNHFTDPRPLEIGNRRFAHRAVLVNSENESLLPPELRNPFYKNPRVAEALAKSSWFAPGENHVVDREAEKIPRHKIYSLLKNAGFVNKRRRRSTFRY